MILLDIQVGFAINVPAKMKNGESAKNEARGRGREEKALLPLPHASFLLSSPPPPRFIFCALPIFRVAITRSLADPGVSFR